MESLARDFAIYDLHFFGGRSRRAHRECTTKTVGIDWCDRCRQLLHPVSCGLCGVGRWRLSCRCGGVDS